MRNVDPKELQINPILMIGREWMLVTAGAPDNFNTMTASWGGMGELWNKPVAFVFVRPQRHTFGFMERESVFTLSFFDREYRPALTLCGTKSGRDTDKMTETGLTPFGTLSGGIGFEQASIILECRKLYADYLDKERFTDMDIPARLYPGDDFHMMYVAEIINAIVK